MQRTMRMIRLPLALLLLAAASPGPAEPLRSPCPAKPQPLPQALDSVAPLPQGRSSVAFSAAPSLDHPGRAWVVRAHQPRPGDAALEIIRLRRRSDCNVYDLEARWQAPLPAADYGALLRAAEGVGIPPPDAFSGEASGGQELVMDGTGIELRLKRFGWETRRTLNHYERSGAAVSAIFRALVDKHVPADERPGEGWRSRR